MAIFRIEKNKNYTVMSNYHFKEKNMTLKAKGLLSLMLSLPDDWDYSINGLVAICKENETSIKNTLEELKKFGYLKVVKILPNQTESGRIEYEYIIYEIPKQEGEKQGVENLGVEFLGVEKQPVENQGQLNTNKLNTNNKNIYNMLNEEKNDKKDNELNELCESLYQDYPKHKGKSDAIKHIKALLTGTKKINGKKVKLTAEEICTAICNYESEIEAKKTSEEYILYASTFFNSRIFDYLEEKNV